MNLNNLEVVSECGILLIQKQIVNKQYTLQLKYETIKII